MKKALAEQFHASLAMLDECVEKCPEDLWLSGEHPRSFWRIAFHAAFFTHYFLGVDSAAFQPWPSRREGIHPGLWETPEYVEPYELPESAEVYDRAAMREYIAFVDSRVGPLLESVDLASNDSGFLGYPEMGKLSHLLMSLRHIQGHVGQLSELLMARQIDTDWVGKGRRSDWEAWLRDNP